MSEGLQAEQVSYRYPGGQRGVPLVSINVQAGEFLLINGPSGCGKSTLARCLTGLIPHLYRGQLSGDVWVAGLRTVDTPLWRLADHAGFVFQNAAAQLLGSSVENEIIFGLENLGLGRDEIARRLEEMLTRFDLFDLRIRAPQSLSGGEQQRLALASVIARHPAILVLDEPLSMLDSTGCGQLVAHLEELARGGTAIVMCEHRKESLARVRDLHVMTMENAPLVTPTTGAVEDSSCSDVAPLPRVSPFTLQLSEVGISLGDTRIVDRLDLEVPSGQIVAIVGCNGAGKTTLLRAVAGLQRHAGQITVCGERPDVAMVFQNPDLQLFNPTVREEILYRRTGVQSGGDEVHRRYRWLLQVLGLAPYELTPPLLLSEGEKKRLSLAVALMSAPWHGILMDEPSLGQDEAHKTRLMRLVRSVADTGRFVIMTTHDLALAAQADRIILLGQEGAVRGACIADGPPTQIFADAGPWNRAGLALSPWFLPAALPLTTTQRPRIALPVGSHVLA